MSSLPSPDVVIAHVARSQFGAFSRRQAVDAGLSERTVDRRLEAGIWSHVHPGVYKHAGTPSTAELLDMAAVLAVGEACLSHLSAAHVHGLVPRPPGPHVMTRHSRYVEVRDVTVHRSRSLDPDEIETVGGMPCTSVPRTLLDLAMILEDRGLQKVVDLATRDGKASRLDIWRRACASRGHHGGKPLRRAIARQPGGIEDHDSDAETAFAGLAERHWPGVFEHHAKVEVFGRKFEADFFASALGVVVEIDGRAHELAEQRSFDTFRDALMIDAGLMVLRLRREVVIFRPTEAIAAVTNALRARGQP
jgi:very-short-patch-repair endonuclease